MKKLILNLLRHKDLSRSETSETVTATHLMLLVVDDIGARFPYVVQVLIFYKFKKRSTKFKTCIFSYYFIHSAIILVLIEV